MISVQYYKGLELKKATGGIAVFDGDKTIYVNKDLFQYPELLAKVLDHELEHYEDTLTESGKVQEVTNMIKAELRDLQDTTKSRDVFLFALKHPRAFLPYMQCGEKRIIIANQLFVFLWALALFGLIFFILAMLII